MPRGGDNAVESVQEQERQEGQVRCVVSFSLTIDLLADVCSLCRVRSHPARISAIKIGGSLIEAYSYCVYSLQLQSVQGFIQ